MLSGNEMENQPSSNSGIPTPVAHANRRPLDTTMRGGNRIVMDATKSPRSVVEYLSDSHRGSLADLTLFDSIDTTANVGSSNPGSTPLSPMEYIRLQPRDSSRIWDQIMKPSTVYYPDEMTRKESFQALPEDRAQFPHEIYFPEL